MGIISPKIKIATVAAPTAMPSPAEPANRTVSAVKITEIKILTRLFPIKEVVKNRCLFCRIFSTRAAFLFFFSRRYFIFNLLTDKKAVSPEEKTIDKKSKNARIKK